MTTPASAHLHTPFYCEENVYHLVQTLVKEHPEKNVYAIFISNQQRQNLLFYQKASGDRQYVIWDYHVIAAVFSQMSDNKLDFATAFAFDLDTALGLNVPWEEYIEETFRPDLYKARGVAETLLELEPPRFRLVPAQDLLSHFASDRSHMLDVSQAQETQYIAEPPSWPVICSSQAQKYGVRHNLWTKYLDMRTVPEKPAGEAEGMQEWEHDGKIYGTVYSLEAIRCGLKGVKA